MDKEVGAVALVLVAIVAVFVALQPMLPSNNEKFSELGVLGPNQTIANYPKNLTAGQQFLIYGYVGDHEGGVAYYKVLIKLGNESTIVTNSSSANAPVVETFSHVLDDNQSWTFPIDLSINQTGTNLKLIFELWQYNATQSGFAYTGVWNDLYVNVTSQ